MLKIADTTTNIQKPPVYKHILPRVLETTTNDEFNNNRDNNTTLTKLPLSPQLFSKQISRLPAYDMPSSIDSIKGRQSRVDRILEKYRRQPSSPVSRQFLRSFSCNSPMESQLSSEPNLSFHTTGISSNNSNGEYKSNVGPRSVSPYALFDNTNLTSTAEDQQEKKTKALTNSILAKSNSLKSLGEYRTKTLSRASSIDQKSTSKLIGALANYDEDPPSSSSSSSSTTTTTNSKSTVSKDDINHYCSPTLLDWSIDNCSEETVSDRIKRRSYYVKLK